MRSAVAVGGLAFLFTWASTALGSPGDEAAVGAVLERYYRAMNDRNSGAFTKLFWEDADFVTATAHWLRGREEIIEGKKIVLDRGFPEGTFAFQIEKVRFLTPEIAIVQLWWNFRRTEPGEPVAGRGTRVLVRREGEWRIAASQNTRKRDVPGGISVPGIQSPSSE